MHDSLWQIWHLMFQSGENPPILKSGFKTPESKLKPQKRFLRHILVEPNVISFSNCSCANLGTMSVMWIVHLSIRLLGMDVWYDTLIQCNARPRDAIWLGLHSEVPTWAKSQEGQKLLIYIYSTSLGSTCNDF